MCNVRNDNNTHAITSHRPVALGRTLFSQDERITQFHEYIMPGDNDCGYHSLGIPRFIVKDQLLTHANDEGIRNLVKLEIIQAVMDYSLDEIFIDDSVTQELYLIRQQYFDIESRISNIVREAKETIQPSGRRDLLNNLSHNQLLSSDIFPESYKSQLRSGITEANACLTRLEDQCATRPVFESYVRHYIGTPGNWLKYLQDENGIHYPSSIDAIARINNLEVNIWCLSPETENQIDRVYHYTTTAPARTVNMFHTRYNQMSRSEDHFNQLHMRNNLEIYPVLTTPAHPEIPKQQLAATFKNQLLSERIHLFRVQKANEKVKSKNEPEYTQQFYHYYNNDEEIRVGAANLYADESMQQGQNRTVAFYKHYYAANQYMKVWLERKLEPEYIDKEEKQEPLSPIFVRKPLKNRIHLLRTKKANEKVSIKSGAEYTKQFFQYYNQDHQILVSAANMYASEALLLGLDWTKAFYQYYSATPQDKEELSAALDAVFEETYPIRIPISKRIHQVRANYANDVVNSLEPGAERNSHFNRNYNSHNALVLAANIYANEACLQGYERKKAFYDFYHAKNSDTQNKLVKELEEVVDGFRNRGRCFLFSENIPYYNLISENPSVQIISQVIKIPGFEDSILFQVKNPSGEICIEERCSVGGTLTQQFEGFTLNFNEGKLKINGFNYQEGDLILSSQIPVEFTADINVKNLVLQSAPAVVMQANLQAEQFICRTQKLINRGKIETQYCQIHAEQFYHELGTLQSGSAGTSLHVRDLKLKSHVITTGSLWTKRIRKFEYGHDIFRVDGTLSLNLIDGMILDKKININGQLDINIPLANQPLENRATLKAKNIKINTPFQMQNGNYSFRNCGQIGENGNAVFISGQGMAHFEGGKILATDKVELQCENVAIAGELRSKHNVIIKTIPHTADRSEFYLNNNLNAPDMLYVNVFGGVTPDIQKLSGQRKLELHNLPAWQPLPTEVPGSLYVSLTDKANSTTSIEKSTHVYGDLTIQAPHSDMSIGNENQSPVTVTVEKNGSVNTKSLNVNDAVVIVKENASLENETTQLKSTSSNRKAGLICGGKAKVSSTVGININRGTIHSKGLMTLVSQGHINNISGTISGKDSASISASEFNNCAQLQEKNDDPQLNTEHFGSVIARKKGLLKDEHYTQPAVCNFEHTLHLACPTNNTGSQISAKNLTGYLPNQVSLIPFTETLSSSFGTCRVDTEMGVPQKAVLSVVESMDVSGATADHVQGIVNAGKSISIAQVNNLQVGAPNDNRALPPVRLFKQSISLLDELRPSACYKDVGGQIQNVLNNNDSELPTMAVLNENGSLEINSTLPSRVSMDVAADLLVRTFMTQLSRNFLDSQTRQSTDILQRLMQNSVNFVSSHQATPGKYESGEPHWFSTLQDPILIFKHDANNKSLIPHVIFPLSWNDPSVRDNASGMFALDTIKIEGASKENSSLLVTGHLRAGNQLGLQNMKKVSIQKTTVSRQVDVINTTKTKVNKGFTNTKEKNIRNETLTETLSRAGASLTAKKVVLENIEEVNLLGADIQSGEGGVHISKNIGTINSSPVITTTIQQHQNGVHTKHVSSKSNVHVEKYKINEPAVESRGTIDLEADKVKLSAQKTAATGNIVISAKKELELGAEVVQQVQPPIHQAKNKMCSVANVVVQQGTPVSLVSEVSVTLMSAGNLNAVAPQILSPEIQISSVRTTKISELCLNHASNTKTIGFPTLLSNQERSIQYQFQTAITPCFMGNNLRIRSQDKIIMVAPYIAVTNVLDLNAKSDIHIQHIELQNDLQLNEFTVGLSSFGSQSVQNLMRHDFQEAAKNLVREFPLLSRIEELSKSKDIADTFGSGMYVLLEAYKTYVNFSKAKDLTDFAKKQFNPTAKITITNREQEAQWTELLIPWIQARSIVMKGCNITVEGLEADAESMSIEAEQDYALKAPKTTSKNKTTEVSASLSVDLKTGIPSVNISQKKSESYDIHYVNSHLNICNQFEIKAGNQISLKGVVIEAARLMMEAENISVETVQDQHESAHTGVCVGTTGITFSTGSQTKSKTKEQTQLKARENLLIRARTELSLKGAGVFLTSENATGTVKASVINHENVIDNDNKKEVSLGYAPGSPNTSESDCIPNHIVDSSYQTKNKTAVTQASGDSRIVVNAGNIQDTSAMHSKFISSTKTTNQALDRSASTKQRTTKNKKSHLRAVTSLDTDTGRKIQNGLTQNPAASSITNNQKSQEATNMDNRRQSKSGKINHTLFAALANNSQLGSNSQQTSPERNVSTSKMLTTLQQKKSSSQGDSVISTNPQSEQFYNDKIPSDSQQDQVYLHELQSVEPSNPIGIAPGPINHALVEMIAHAVDPLVDEVASRFLKTIDLSNNVQGRIEANINANYSEVEASICGAIGGIVQTESTATLNSTVLTGAAVAGVKTGGTALPIIIPVTVAGLVIAQESGKLVGDVSELVCHGLFQAGNALHQSVVSMPQELVLDMMQTVVP